MQVLERLRPIVVHAIALVGARRSILKKAASFGLVGIVNTFVDLGVFLLARNVFAWALVPANVAAWLVAVSLSYVMNSFTTFAAESGRQLRLKDYASFVASGVVGVVANTATLVFLSYFVPEIAAKLVAIVVSFVVNFSLSHFVVFRRRRDHAPEGR
jgi:putative flippase GtrA